MRHPGLRLRPAPRHHRRPVRSRRRRPGPLPLGASLDDGSDGRHHRASAPTGATVVRPQRSARARGGARHARLGAWRLLAGCGGGYCRRGSRRAGATAARLCPPFALEHPEQINPHQLIDHLPKPRPDGRTTPALSPLEQVDALAALILPPRRHRHHGVLAANSPLRAAVTAYGREETPSPSPSPSPSPNSISVSPGHRRLLREAVLSPLVSAPVWHGPEPAPVRRFGRQRSSREVAPPCFRILTAHPGSTPALPQPQLPPQAAWISYPVSVSARPPKGCAASSRGARVQGQTSAPRGLPVG